MKGKRSLALFSTMVLAACSAQVSSPISYVSSGNLIAKVQKSEGKYFLVLDGGFARTDIASMQEYMYGNLSVEVDGYGLCPDVYINPEKENSYNLFLKEDILVDMNECVPSSKERGG